MECLRLKDVDLGKHVGERLYVSFLVKNFEVRLQKDNITEYINLVMSDRGCDVEAKIFGNISSYKENMKNGQVWYGGLDVKPYAKSQTGWSALLVSPQHEPNISPNEYLNWSKFTQEASALVTQKFNYIGTEYGTDSVYYKIVQAIISSRTSAFQTSAAATKNHHNELGGLMVHTAEVLMLCDKIASFYNERYKKPNTQLIDYGLLYAGAILHDIGKLEELQVDPGSGTVEYAPISSVMPHILSGICVVQQYAACLGIGLKTQGKTDEQVALEKSKLDMLTHCIAAHHGLKEYGSPVEPATIEAYIIHKADIMSSEIYRFGNNLNEMEVGEVRKVYVAGKYEQVYKHE